MPPRSRGPLARASPLTHELGHALHIPAAGEVIAVPVPKDRGENVAWRRRILAAAEADEGARDAWRRLCSQPHPDSLLLWINLFGWTYRQNVIADDGKQKAITGGGVDVPFITWPVQDRLVRAIVGAIEGGHDAAVDKARDMGLTWLLCAVTTWYWLFRPGTNSLVMSRVEELVDNPGDPDSLFWKIDYLLAALPWWIRPEPGEMRRGYMKLVNARIGTTIIGRSTTAKQGRAGRRTFVVIDEAGMIDSLRRIHVSMSSTTDCVLYNSTPWPGSFFSELVRSPSILTLSVDWWEHPEKGLGRYEARDEETGEIRVRSPWFDRREEEAVDAEEVTQELLRDHDASGYQVFRARVLDEREHACGPPLLTGAIEPDLDAPDAVLDDLVRRREIGGITLDEAAPRPPWSLWIPLDGTRPPQDRTYVFGIDVSWGLRKSNSCIVVIDLDTMEQVGEFADGRYDPKEFARLAAAAGLWWGGPRGCAFMAWESNGPGETFGETIRALRYPWVYTSTGLDRTTRARVEQPGWRSNPARKAGVCAALAEALRRDEITLRSARLIKESRAYVYTDDGGVGPGPLQDESSVARRTHGDRVIAAAVALHASQHASRCRPPERAIPRGSIADRRRRARRRA